MAASMFLIIWLFALAAIAGIFLLLASGPMDARLGTTLFVAALIAALALIVSGIGGLVYYFRGPWVRYAGLVMAAILICGVSFQLARGAWERYRDEQAFSAAAFFADKTHRSILDAIRAKDVTRVRELLPHAGDVNRPGPKGARLLYHAVLWADPGNTQIVEALLQAGADPNLPSETQTPLDEAASKDPQMLRLILRSGADPNTVRADGTPVWFQLLGYGSEENLDKLRLFLDGGVSLHVANHLGENPFQVAAENPRALDMLRAVEFANAQKLSSKDGAPLQ